MNAALARDDAGDDPVARERAREAFEAVARIRFPEALFTVGARL